MKNEKKNRIDWESLGFFVVLIGAFGFLITSLLIQTTTQINNNDQVEEFCLENDFDGYILPNTGYFCFNETVITPVILSNKKVYEVKEK